MSRLKLLIMGFCLVCCQFSFAKEPDLKKYLEDNSRQATNIKLVSRLFLEYGDIFDRYEQILSQDVLLHGPVFGQETRGLENLKQLDRDLISQYDGVFMKIDEISAFSDKVVVFWAAVAIKDTLETHVSGHAIYRIAQGKICEIWQTWDKIESI